MSQIALKLLLAPFTLFILCAQIQADESSAIWIDVRTPAEFASIHVEGATNIEFQEIADHIAKITTDKEADIRLYCRSGSRSGVAKETLTKLGYTNVVNAGGLAAALASYEKPLTKLVKRQPQ